jgi:hypothetical protein
MQQSCRHARTDEVSRDVSGEATELTPGVFPGQIDTSLIALLSRESYGALEGA